MIARVPVLRTLFDWSHRLYNWVLHWAETPYGLPALFLLAFAEASFFPIPPDPLLIALAISIPRRSFLFATYCSLASVLGGMLGYGLGKLAWHSLSDFFFNYVPGFTPELFLRVQNIYQEWDFWAVFTAGFTPIPFKVFTIAAGVFDIHFVIFCVAAALSRSARFFLVSVIIWKFGEPIKGYIDRYFNLLCVVFLVLLLGGFYLIKYVL
ncbi:DedA family protein [bacterium]|nr:DedA family protein [bacterium]